MEGSYDPINKYLWEENFLKSCKEQSFKVKLFYSQAPEIILSQRCGSERLRFIFRERSDSGLWISASCFRKPIKELSDREIFLGEALVRAACEGISGKVFGKCYGIRTNEAWQLLNQFYALFGRYKKEDYKKAKQDFDSEVTCMLIRCAKGLKLDWKFITELEFEVPSCTAFILISKFFHHYFDLDRFHIPVRIFVSNEQEMRELA